MANNLMQGAEILMKALKDQGVTKIFGYPGGAVLPLYDALHQQNAIRHILVRQEGGAVHAAEGYARSTGKVGVVLVTSGPGGTNAVTGLTDALMDSIPLVCITGQVPTHLIGNDAFQECDTTGITRPCTKHNYLVKDVNDLARIVHEAFHVIDFEEGAPGAKFSKYIDSVQKDAVPGTSGYVDLDLKDSHIYQTETAAREMQEKFFVSVKAGLGGLVKEDPHNFRWVIPAFLIFKSLHKLTMHDWASMYGLPASYSEKVK